MSEPNAGNAGPTDAAKLLQQLLHLRIRKRQRWFAQVDLICREIIKGVTDAGPGLKINFSNCEVYRELLTMLAAGDAQDADCMVVMRSYVDALRTVGDASLVRDLHSMLNHHNVREEFEMPWHSRDEDEFDREIVELIERIRESRQSK